MAAPKKDNVTRNLVIGMIALVVVVGVAVSFGSNMAKKNAATPSLVDKSNGYGIVFNKELTGVPKLDIWEDFQCPVCKNFEAANGKQIQQWIEAKKVTVTYHVLSFIGSESGYTANAAACAADENKFLQLHNVFYSSQGTENSGLWSEPTVIAAGVKAGITSKSFAECVTSVKYKDWVNNVAADGNKRNVNSTPTVFVNGKEIERTNANYFDPNTFAKRVLG